MNVGEASAGERMAEFCPLWWALLNGTEGGHPWHQLPSSVHLRVILATFLPAGCRAPVFMVMFWPLILGYLPEFLPLRFCS